MPKVHPDNSVSWRTPEPCSNRPSTSRAKGRSVKRSWPLVEVTSRPSVAAAQLRIDTQLT
jgi:hypothetical protein